MAKTKRSIFTIGFDLPSEEFECIEFRSVRTLLDADIILFEPTLGDVSFEPGGGYNGTSTLSHSCGLATSQALSHWRSEINAAVNAGKVVIVYLAPPEQYWRYTGEKQFSGSGRSRVTTNIVTEISSYSAVPVLKRVTPKTGNDVSVVKGTPIAEYWEEFSDHSVYLVEIGCEGKMRPALTVGPERVVGAIFTGSRGALLFLPPLRLENEESFLRVEQDGTYWTAEAEKFGKKLATRLRALAKSLLSDGPAPAPAWVQSHQYRTGEEERLEQEIAQVNVQIEVLQQTRIEQESRLVATGTLKRVLYEQGKPLEAAVIEAVQLLGFSASPFSDGSSEFDAVLVCKEGRCIGEAEGKDNKAINIEKFAQLERNLQEDFAREEVSQFAKAVLFGNAQRLLPLDKRTEFFTEKCLSAAKRVGAALVRTPDLFEPARYMKENPMDAEYAANCRMAIFAAKGEIVSFPQPPLTTVVGSAKEAMAIEGNERQAQLTL